MIDPTPYMQEMIKVPGGMLTPASRDRLFEELAGERPMERLATLLGLYNFRQALVKSLATMKYERMSPRKLRAVEVGQIDFLYRAVVARTPSKADINRDPYDQSAGAI